MRTALLSLSLLLAPLSSAGAQVQLGFHLGVPGVSIGVVVPAYPELVQVPGQPVYYAPAAAANYFFFDGTYWVFQEDRWYASAWYDGPWAVVSPEYVPAYVLQVPVRYYRRPPAYFHGWRGDDSPRWGERWGREWEHRRSGWDRRDGHAAPRPAALPVYQREHRGDRSPRDVERQHAVAAGSGHERSRDDGARGRRGSDDGRGHGRGGGDDDGRGHGRGGGGDDGRGGGHGRDRGDDHDD